MVATRLQAPCPAFAGVLPQHAGQQKAGGHRLAFAHAAVGVDQGGIDQRVFGAFHHQVKQRVNAPRQTCGLELRNAGQSVAGLQQLEHFVKQAALWHIGQQRQRGGNGLAGFGIELETQGVELGAKTHRADDAHRVFAVARGHVANHAQHLFLGVADAVVKIDHHLRLRVVVHGVDAEVAPRRIVLNGAPHVVAQHPAAGVYGVFHAGEFAFAGAFVAPHLLGVGAVQMGAEGGHLNHLVVAATAMHHVHDAKTPTDDEGTAKQTLDLLGCGVGGHIKVLGPQTQQQVAHRTADNVGFKSGLLQCAHNLDCAVVYQFWLDAVFAGGDVAALAKAASGAGFAQQFVDEFFDHGVFQAASGVPNKWSTRQPRSSAMARRRSSGLVATGSFTRSSKGRSLMESL